LIADHQEQDRACCCSEKCRECSDSRTPVHSDTNCPVSGLPCHAVITSANPTILVDVVDPPPPSINRESLVVGNDLSLPLTFVRSLSLWSDPRPFFALVELGQLLRV
jgi:hypothetical protein